MIRRRLPPVRSDAFRRVRPGKRGTPSKSGRGRTWSPDHTLKTLRRPECCRHFCSIVKLRATLCSPETPTAALRAWRRRRTFPVMHGTGSPAEAKFLSRPMRTEHSSPRARRFDTRSHRLSSLRQESPSRCSTRLLPATGGAWHPIFQGAIASTDRSHRRPPAGRAPRESSGSRRRCHRLSAPAATGPCG